MKWLFASHWLLEIYHVYRTNKFCLFEIRVYPLFIVYMQGDLCCIDSSICKWTIVKDFDSG